METQKKLRTLKDIQNDPRVDSIHREEDDGFSWWCYLKPGFQAYGNKQHAIHERTIKRVIQELEDAEIWQDDPSLKISA